MTLYHYTCSHGRRAIGRRGLLRPNTHPLIPGPAVVWLTHMTVPDRDALGLTSSLLPCDRLAYRYTVRPTLAVRHWVDWVAELGMDMPPLPGDPTQWFVCPEHIPAILDRRYLP